MVDRGVQDVLQRLVDFLSKQRAKVSDTARPDIELAQAQRVFSMLVAAATSARQPRDGFEADLVAAAALKPSDQSARAPALRGNTLHHRHWVAPQRGAPACAGSGIEYFKEYDVLLCPVYPLPAHLHCMTCRRGDAYAVNDGRVSSHSQLVFWAGLRRSCVSACDGCARRSYIRRSAGRRADRQIHISAAAPRSALQKLLEKEIPGFCPAAQLCVS